MTESDAKALDSIDHAALKRQGWGLDVDRFPSARYPVGCISLYPLDRRIRPYGGSEDFRTNGLADAIRRLLRRFRVRLPPKGAS